MGYKFGKRSQRELIGVHPQLALVMYEAIKRSEQDFMIFDGIRTTHEQRRLVQKKLSKTMNSFHLYGLAADAVAFVDGKPSWEPKFYPPIIECVTDVAKEYGFDVRNGYEMWGWDMPHFQLHSIDGRPARDVYDVRKFR